MSPLQAEVQREAGSCLRAQRDGDAKLGGGAGPTASPHPPSLWSHSESPQLHGEGGRLAATARCRRYCRTSERPLAKLRLGPELAEAQEAANEAPGPEDPESGIPEASISPRATPPVDLARLGPVVFSLLSPSTASRALSQREKTIRKMWFLYIATES